MQPQDPRDPYTTPQAYPPQSPASAQGPLQPQIPGQPETYMPPMPVYQPPPLPKNANTAPNPGPDMAPPPAAPTSPYDFFMQPKQPVAQRPLPMGGKLIGTRPGTGGSGGFSLGGRNFIFAIAGAIGLIALIFMAIVLFSPKDQTGPQFFSIAQTQQELIRICDQSSGKAKIQTTRNFAATCTAGVTNNQTELFAYMKKNKLSYEPKLLGAKANSQTTARLAQAESSSTYDSTFREVIRAQLTAYSRALTSQLATTTGTNGREVLTKSQKSAELLLLMLSDESDTITTPST